MDKIKLTRMARTALIALLVLGVCGGLPQLTPIARAQTTLNCSSSYQIIQTVGSGAKWEMCWEPKAGYGYRLTQIAYTPPNGSSRLVLQDIHVAQLFVPYDDSGPRYHDLSYGVNLNVLTADDCPNGQLLTNATLCLVRRPRGYAFNSVADGQRMQGDSASVYGYFSVGNYYYITQYTFYDDGSIEPVVGASGSLQRYGGSVSTGWPVKGQIAINHNHVVIWRMDFDVNGSTNNLVEQIDFSGSGTDIRNMTITPLITETKSQASLSGLRFWRVRNLQTANADGHSISYEIEPNVSDQYRAGEAFTQNDFYVTKYNGNEMLVDDGAGLDKFVNGETVTDAVVWYSTDFHHTPRDEDDVRMPVHWQGYLIRPRDLQTNTGATGGLIPTPMPTSSATPLPTVPPTPAVTATPAPTLTPTAAVSACNAYEPNDVRTQASPISIGETQNLAFCVANDNDWAVVNLSAGITSYIETLNLGASTDTVLRLYDSNGNQLVYNDDYGSGTASQIQFTPTSSGYYYIQANQYGGSGGANYTYSLKVR